MPELAPRLRCPVCLGVTMEKVRVGEDAPVEIDHCGRCGGVWLEYGEVQLLRRQPAAALWTAIVRRGAEEAVAAPCHDCHAPFDRTLPECPACGWKSVIDCPCCGRPMRRESRGGTDLDVCHGCKGAWFDHHELDAIWAVQASMALEHRSAGSRLAEAGAVTGDVMLDVLFYAPDVAIYGAAHAVSGIAQVAAHVPEMAAAAPEAAITVVEVAGEAAGGVFHVIVSIFEGVFGLLDF
jgi:Zn-finger nucleic acid-binding protein